MKIILFILNAILSILWLAKGILYNDPGSVALGLIMLITAAVLLVIILVKFD